MNLKRIPIFLIPILVLAITSCKRDPKPADELAFCSRKNKEVVLRLEAEPDNLNPLLTTTGYSTLVNYQLFGYLLTIDPLTMQLTPYLAKSRPQIEELTSGPYSGGMSYTFEIHQEAVWDNGAPVTGNDYIFTLKATLNPLVTPAKRYVPFIQFIKEIQVDPANPRKFTVLTAEKLISGEERVASTLFILPEYAYDPEGLLKNIPLTDFTDQAKLEILAENDDRLSRFADNFQDPKYRNDPAFVTGCGAYRLESWEAGQRLVLVKKTGWWGDKLVDSYPALGAYPERIIIKPIQDGATALTALKAEEIDVMGDLAPKDFSELSAQADSSCYRYEAPVLLQSAFLSLNTRSPKLADKRVRRALANVIDVDEIVEALFYGLAERVNSPAHPSASYYNKDLNPIPYDPEATKKLLEEAGWKDTNNNGTVDKTIGGQLTEMNLRYAFTLNREISKQIGLLIQEKAKLVGIDIVLEGKDFNQMLEDRRRGDFEIMAAGRSLSPLLWEPKQNYHTTGDNQVGFGNEYTDSLIDRIQSTFDDGERLKLYKELQAILYDELPEIYILAPKGRIAVHKRLEGPTMPMFPGYYVNLFKTKDAD